MINFNRYDERELIAKYNVLNATRKRKLTLERIEEIAAYYGNPSSIKAISEAFDNYVRESGIGYPIDDKPAMREALNNFTDNMCKNGSIHSEQYRSYYYVGKYDMDD